jgi:tRNA(Ser,Leu) C12 N-acetylase TAN1
MVGISGIVMIRVTDLDLMEIMSKIAQLETTEAYFIHTLKIRPIQHVIPADYQALKDLVAKMFEGIIGTYRISVEHRHTQMQSDVIIDAAASVIPNKVSLKNFDWELWIQVVANEVGVSLLPRNGIYSTREAFEVSSSTAWYLEKSE